MTAGGTRNAHDIGGWLGLGPAATTYRNCAVLAAALTNFSDNAETPTGRKCDVTYTVGATAAGLHNDPGTLTL
jgi:hypothetical protein